MLKKKKMVLLIRGLRLLEQQMLCLFLPILLLLAATPVKAGGVGFCYGRFMNNLPAPADVVSLLVAKSITKIRIFDNDQSVIQAFANTNIELMIGIPNGDLSDFQTETQAATWVSSYLAPMATDTKISIISVGSEVVTNYPTYTSFLFPAMKNIHTALAKAGLSQIQVTTANSMAILQDSFPPSAAVFNQSFATSFMKPLLDYLHSIGSFVMINAYPYLAYTVDSSRVPLDYALFQAQQAVVDPNTNLEYNSLYDAQLDALYFAMESTGHSELKVVVSESGWPTKGDQGESGATLQNAQTYNNNLIARVVKDVGTPHRPDAAIDVYIFSLFNENLKAGEESERNWGVFNVDGTPIYKLDLEGVNTSTPTTSTNSTPAPPTASQNLTTNNVGGTWCVARPGVSNSSLADGINWACGQGKVNCTLIQEGQACYQPNTFQNHASYAYNSYFHDNGGNAASCNFNGTAVTTNTNPSYGSCIFASSSVSSSNTNGTSSSTSLHHSTFHWSFRIIPIALAYKYAGCKL
ncbi:hypothetical protein GOP47_0015671 [Adiantum capillus-veneris]|uniref:glucan endo-1,3-beta-D-glucosidase n=1 Tax=Adiantum capillus-veneris TaxID=13818 RepID=A0A9D4ZDF0_ADICA|nr:hypothetical protein GOP47_0015671 [Adiantum capillus-veneris]